MVPGVVIRIEYPEKEHRITLLQLEHEDTRHRHWVAISRANDVRKGDSVYESHHSEDRGVAHYSRQGKFVNRVLGTYVEHDGPKGE